MYQHRLSLVKPLWVESQGLKINASVQPRFKNLRERSCLITHKLDGATGGIFFPEWTAKEETHCGSEKQAIH